MAEAATQTAPRLRPGCRFSLRLVRIFARFTRRSRQQLKQKRACDEQEEKQIFEMYCDHVRVVKSLNRISIHELRFAIHRSLLINHVPSVRGLSVPAIDSRIDVSACTFFIR